MRGWFMGSSFGFGVYGFGVKVQVLGSGVRGLRVYGSVLQPLHTLAARSGARYGVGSEVQGSGVGAWGCALWELLGSAFRELADWLSGIGLIGSLELTFNERCAWSRRRQTSSSLLLSSLELSDTQVYAP